MTSELKLPPSAEEQRADSIAYGDELGLDLRHFAGELPTQRQRDEEGFDLLWAAIIGARCAGLLG